MRSHYGRGPDFSVWKKKGEVYLRMASVTLFLHLPIRLSCPYLFVYYIFFRYAKIFRFFL